MSSLRLAWKLEGATVLVVGAGPVAEGKVEVLRGTGADLVVVGPEPTPRIVDLAAAGALRLVERRVRRRDVIGVRLVVAATGHRRVNRRVRRWAHLARAVVNVVDDPALCDVTFPAVVRRGAATVAVSTAGASPASARFVREEIERALPPAVADLIDTAAAARRDLRAAGRYRYDYPAWRQRLLEPGLAAVRADGSGALGEIRRRFLAGFDGPTAVTTGSVVLVGAGPGGPDLITVRGARALAAADVVVYDRLADPGLLELAPVAAERIPVGKAKGGGVAQDEIHRLLVDRARAGFRVVRLKGGDPFVFGRGSEELDAMTAAGIAVEVVPGLTSAVAGPALAGIPVTHRGTAASFTVLSGHRIADLDHRWEALASSASTLVVLMGASTARGIAERLRAAGRPADEPVAVIHRAGYADQQTASVTLGGLARDGSPLPSPSVLVIGPVAGRLPNDVAGPKRGSRPQRPMTSMMASSPLLNGMS
ncbi:MAG: uroporphyrinogen-III C-methyltransferase [Acidimicrobiales bacterium]